MADEVLSLSATVSSLLFVSPKPLSAKRIARALNKKTAEIEEVLESLRELYQEEVYGFSLQEVSGAWQLRTSDAAAESIKKLYPAKDKKLSRASAETLAVIAYKQPVPRSEIEAIRGVDALPTLKTLLDAQLIRIIGHENTAGQPALYGTTKKFLEKFGLKDLASLPQTKELEELALEPGEPELADASEEEEGFQESSVM